MIPRRTRLEEGVAMRKWMAVGAASVAALLAILAVTLTGGGSGRGEAVHKRDRGARFEVKDPDKNAKPGTITPAREAFVNRAYPRSYIPAAAVLKATWATRSMPTRLKASQFRPGTRNAAASAGVGADW